MHLSYLQSSFSKWAGNTLEGLCSGLHKWAYEKRLCSTPIEMSRASPFQMSPSVEYLEEFVADDGGRDEPERDRPDARVAGSERTADHDQRGGAIDAPHTAAGVPLGQALPPGWSSGAGLKTAQPPQQPQPSCSRTH